MNTNQLSIVTPNGKIFDGQVESLTVPGKEGVFGVLAGHTPIIALLKKGIASFSKDKMTHFMVIGPGILEVNGEHNVLLLTDEAAAQLSQLHTA